MFAAFLATLVSRRRLLGTTVQLLLLPVLLLFLVLRLLEGGIRLLDLVLVVFLLVIVRAFIVFIVTLLFAMILSFAFLFGGTHFLSFVLSFQIHSHCRCVNSSFLFIECHFLKFLNLLLILFNAHFFQNLLIQYLYISLLGLIFLMDDVDDLMLCYLRYFIVFALRISRLALLLFLFIARPFLIFI